MINWRRQTQNCQCSKNETPTQNQISGSVPVRVRIHIAKDNGSLFDEDYLLQITRRQKKKTKKKTGHWSRTTDGRKSKEGKPIYGNHYYHRDTVRATPSGPAKCQIRRGAGRLKETRLISNGVNWTIETARVASPTPQFSMSFPFCRKPSKPTRSPLTRV